MYVSHTYFIALISLKFVVIFFDYLTVEFHFTETQVDIYLFYLNFITIFRELSTKYFTILE